MRGLSSPYFSINAWRRAGSLFSLPMMMLTGSPGARWIKIKLIVNTIKMVIIPVKKRRRIYLFNVLTEQCLHLPPLGVKMKKVFILFNCYGKAIRKTRNNCTRFILSDLIAFYTGGTLHLSPTEKEMPASWISCKIKQ